MSFIWNDLLVNPMINALITMSNAMLDNFGLAIIAFTIFIRLITFPLTIKQLRTTRAMQEMQPQMQEIQKKYKDPKRRQQEMMKLYRDVGFNPLGCLLPFAVQIPIWIALFHVIRYTVGTTPEALLDLSRRLYDWGYITESVPLSSNFIGIDLAERSIPLAILVAAATFYQQKLSTATRPQVKDDRQAATNKMMLYMMPLLFGWFTMTVPSGLGLYWFTTSVVAILQAYLYYKPDNITWRWLVSMEALPPSAKARQRAAASSGDGRGAAAGKRAETPQGATASADPVAAGAADGSSSQSAAARRRRRRRRRRGRSGGARSERGD
ncbi:MAG: YidC/Oxa1 family membrane protein insertase [Chloroflexi bacterium]|nr:YidC/Oxa1 family membrane protein insertase [Chloroflexota bacterium]